jgi:hypothetical protein
VLFFCLIEYGQTGPLSTHHKLHELCAKNFKKWALVIFQLEIIKRIFTVFVTYVSWKLSPPENLWPSDGPGNLAN